MARRRADRAHPARVQRAGGAHARRGPRRAPRADPRARLARRCRPRVQRPRSAHQTAAREDRPALRQRLDPDRARPRLPPRRDVRQRLRSQPITVRITAGFLCAMALLFALTGAFIYERMQFALNRSIRDVPSTNRAELAARRHHRDEALHELLAQLAVAFSATLLVTGVVGHRVARAALDPVERMRRRASSESAHASFRLPVPDGDDELARLARTLNELLARVQAGVERERRLIADASHELR